MTLFIEGKRRSLRVEINEDTGVFVFAGVSLPENTNAFFEPVIQEIKEYTKNPKDKTAINFYIEYLNTSSALYLRKILMLCEESLGAKNLMITWHYEEDDTDIKEFGEDFRSIFSNVTVELKAIDKYPYYSES